MKVIAKERSDDEKKEIYDKWKSLINMSEKELVEWGEDPDHLEASLNRQEAKDNGKIQSGYDSFHRIKRRKDKPFEDWTAQDFDNASQENGFNGRMLGGNPGKPVGSTGMSKWEISLRNWGHDPSKPNSPSHTKWKKWKKENEEEIKMSLAKKKKANLISDLYQMSFKVKGGENLRKACLMCLNTKRASEESITPEIIETLPEAKQEKLKFDVIVASLDQLMSSIKSKIGTSLHTLKDYIVEYTPHLFNGKNLLSQKLKKPISIQEKATIQILNSFVDKKDPQSLIKFVVNLIQAETPEEISALLKVPVYEIQGNLKVFAIEASVKHITILFLSLMGLVWGTSLFMAGLSGIGMGLAVALFLTILTNAQTTANFVDKLVLSLVVIPSTLISRLIPKLKVAYGQISDVLVEAYGWAKQKGTEAYGWAKQKSNAMFGPKQQVIDEAIKLASINPIFYGMLEERLF